MTPEQNRNSFSVEIKELKEDGISDEPIEFISYSELDKFVHRQNGYVYQVVKTSKASAKENILSAVLHFNTAQKSTARITLSQRSITSR